MMYADDNQLYFFMRKGNRAVALDQKCVLMKKLSKNFLQHLPVPVRNVAKSFKVVIIPVLYVNLKTHTHADFL